ncbi:MAG: SusC/RagA family TonB-linked outer membrane protein [Candidatus Marinimicrobia bacterium]|nr:SusC/RagA family TonB-linked outer membrane protein [Candidatus Neomarinimicrobiota bacterium]
MLNYLSRIVRSGSFLPGICMLFALQMLSAEIIHAQDKTVSGTVTNEKGEALFGVNVVVKNTDQGTMTDENGNYTLSIPENANTLVFSHIAYQDQQVEIGGQTTINIQMATRVGELSEVVVVGYGEKEREDVTGSISSIDAAGVQETPTISPDQLLRGKVSGVQVVQTSGQPGSGFQVNVRGVASINGSNEPLYVIDGVPVNNQDNSELYMGGTSRSPLARLNPNDIESIEVLKDASSAAIYGSRATNGVVLITTKRGGEDGISLQFNASTGFSQLPKQIDLVGTSKWMDIINEGIDYYNSDRNLTKGDEVNRLSDPRGQIGPGLDGYWYEFTDPYAQQPYNLDPNRSDTDWMDLVTRDRAMVSNYQLSASGSSGNTQFYASLGTSIEQGIINTNGFDRISGRLNLNHGFSDRFNMGFRVGLTRMDHQRVPNAGIGNGIFTRNLEARPFEVPYQNDGSYMVGGKDIARHNGIQVLNELDAETKDYSVLGTVFSNLEFLGGFRWHSALSADLNYLHDYRYRTVLHPYGGPGGIVVDARTLNQNYLIENTLTYQRTIGNFDSDIMVGYNFEKNEMEQNDIDGRDFPSSSFGYIASAARINDANSMWTANSLESIIGRINVGYANKYLMSFALRRDGSSKFAEGNKYGSFPSASIGWRISEENFFAFDTVTDLKLRASYGQTGNQNGIGNFAAIPSASGGENYLENTGIAITNPGNEELQWETATQYNFGLDLELLYGRFRLTADYFIKNTDNLLYNRPLYTTTGFSQITQNIGSMENRGFELGLRTFNLSSNTFRWTTDFNISFVNNKLTKLIGTEDIMPVGGWHALKVGEPLGTFHMLDMQGIYQNESEIPQALYDQYIRPGDVKFADINNNGSISAADYTIVGDANPDFFGGLANTFAYKNLELSVFLDFSVGQDIYAGWAQQIDVFWPLMSLRQEVADNRWTGPNSTNEYPRAIVGSSRDFNRQSSDRFLYDGSYLKVRNIRLGYTLPQKLSGKLMLSRIKLFVSAQNLFTFTNYPGYDPEVSRYTDAKQQGVDYYNVPPLRSVTVGMNLGF